jgi:hypothetical protein
MPRMPLERCIRARRYGAGRPVMVEVDARACPLRQLQKTHGGCGGASVSTAQQRATLLASEAVTAVTDYSSSSPLFFGRRVIDVQSPKRRPPTTASSKKLHSLPSSIRRIIQRRGHSCAPEAAAGRRDHDNATALGRNGQLCCCAVSSGVWSIGQRRPAPT